MSLPFFSSVLVSSFLFLLDRRVSKDPLATVPNFMSCWSRYHNNFHLANRSKTVIVHFDRRLYQFDEARINGFYLACDMELGERNHYHAELMHPMIDSSSNVLSSDIFDGHGSKCRLFLHFLLIIY